ncbi:MAG: 5-formyltetrahydrofolate cyclo-ligase [Rhodothermales bacterium]|nr:5-formyltetrahydrofolate cyclo-ligase [Rhodothermales bacterium]
MKQPFPDPAARKADLRRAASRRRSAVDETAAAERSRAIVDRLCSLDLLSEAGCVHAFWPIHEKREVDLRSMLRSWVREGRTVVLPVVKKSAPGSPPELEHRRFTSENELVVSKWGIAEPVVGEEIDPRKIDVILVPALAVDDLGTRLGYGKGFYDGFLSTIEAVRVCPIYDDDVVSSLPREDHDEQVDIIVTECRTMTPGRT